MTRWTAGVVVAAIALPVIGGPSPRADWQAPAWPAGLVRADVVVTDAGGAAVRGLSARDFEVRVDGEARPVEFLSAVESPLTLAILVDVSASLHLCPAGVAGIPSTAGPRLASTLRTTRLPGPIPPAVAEFPLRGIKTGDRLRLGSVSRRPILSERPLMDARAIQRDWRAIFALPPIDWLGPSPVHDAVLAAVRSIAAEPAPRAVIVMTDGLASGNHHGHREVAESAARAGVSISAVVEELMTATTPMRPLSDFGVDQARDLRAMAELTGGILVFDRGVWNQEGLCYVRFPADHLAKAIDMRRQAYVIGFAAAPAGGAAAETFSLDIRVIRPGVVVHSRRVGTR